MICPLLPNGKLLTSNWEDNSGHSGSTQPGAASQEQPQAALDAMAGFIGRIS
jgi:hypothetical protein